MKDTYRRFLIITISLLVGFLVVSIGRQMSSSMGFLEFVKNTGPQLSDVKKINLTLAKKSSIRPEDVSILSQLNDEYSRISAAVMPSVVSINTAGVGDKRVRDRFGRISTQTERTQGQGSGVIVSKEGHILTNYHVIANMQEIKVSLADGTAHTAKIIGTDSALDIAVLKLNGEGTFSPLVFGNSDQMREGNIVLAFGNPFGIGKSITQGVISARERSISDLQGGLLQSSAEINPGYSGGPLVNIYGEIIGINSSIFNNDEKNPGFQGISFSIPSNIARRTFLDICERGKPVRGFLGISCSPMVDSTKQKLAYPHSYGALITDVGPRTPAAEAGLQPKDVIVSYGNKAVRDPEQLIGFIQRSEVNQKIDLRVWRNQAEIKTKITVGEWNKDLAEVPATRLGETEQTLRKVGVVVTYLNSRHRRAGITGVRVTKVGEAALAAGLIKPNDIIYQVNRYRINQPNEFYSLIAMSAPKSDTEFFIIRNGKVLANPVRMPQLNK